jgi:hypothetical protein
MSAAAQPAPILTYRTAADMVAAHPAPTAHYEAHGAILLEDCGIEFDEAFVHRLVFPPHWKKLGTVNSMTVPPLVYAQGSFRRTQNPLCRMIKEDWMLMKTYSELLRLELGFKLLVTELFPDYRGIHWVNCTFRFTRTENEGPHLDVFSKGRPLRGRLPRLKFFLNVDSEPRVWNVGPRLADVLKHSHGALGRAAPNDVNVLNHRINESGILAQCGYVRVEIPPRGIVFANGATVVHQVLFGQRMVALEGFLPRAPGAAPSEWDLLETWIRDAGYEVEAVERPQAEAVEEE